MRLSLAQISIEPAAVSTNLETAIAAIERAAQADAELVVLPELFAVGYFAFDAYERSAEPLDGPLLGRLAEAAREHDLAVLAGTIVEDLAASRAAGEPTPADAGLANTGVLFDASGERRLVYRKHHLFGYRSAEADRLVPGERLAVADIGEFTVGVTTCYDLRFPELYRELMELGAELVLVPSAWPYPRVEHWQVLPRARAVENLQYVAAANGVGSFDGAALVGRSTVYDPWGTPIAASDDEATVVHAECDPERMAAVRDRFPALRDRRSTREDRG